MVTFAFGATGSSEEVQPVTAWGFGLRDLWGWGQLWLCYLCSLFLENNIVVASELSDRKEVVRGSGETYGFRDGKNCVFVYTYGSWYLMCCERMVAVGCYGGVGER